ncbi:zinc finger CCCH domain-containing protein 13 isoform X2 [Melanotaenia boesemani]|uniref:zinc finger CCCH domain-containing protein 13 isoform X2 n=1 Tax=Melanotaenia boesemani TaxID=1250792 RepID=UPI001C051D25|nr:zinc finger CCCH domain-containing protein 13 isoform X2 [Melanotaenia boesemani]
MGTKKPCYTLTDTLSKAISGGPRLQQGGKISQNPTSRSKMTASLEQDRDNKQEENWRDCGFAPRFREGDREWKKTERRQEDDRGKNWRLHSNNEKEIKGWKSKGDTFPRIRKDKADYAAEMAAERRERRQRDRPRGEKKDVWERERYRDNERDVVWSRSKDPRERTADDERSRQRDRYKVSSVDFQDKTRDMKDPGRMREGDRTRKMEMQRPDREERKDRMYSPYRTADRDIYMMKTEQRSEGRRDVRSEEDSAERGQKRERKRNREEEEFIHQLSRSVEDNKGKTDWERDRDRQRYRERDREIDRSRRREMEDSREMYRENDRRAAKQADWEGERWRESKRQEDGRYREERLDWERKKRREYRTGRGSGSQSDSASREPPRAQSSGEWSSDLDSKAGYGRDRDRRREGTYEHKRGKERKRDPERSEKQQMRIEKRENNREEITGNRERGKWLEPQRGKNSQDKYLDGERHTRQKEWRNEEERNIDSQAEWGRNGRRIEEESHERHLEHGGRIEYRKDPEGVSVDAEEESEIWRETNKKGKEHLSDSDGGIGGSRQRDAVGDNTEESDKEEEGGSDIWARSEGEEGCEAGWKHDKERMLSGDDCSVTLSSGRDEDERENEEVEFYDCHEVMEVGVTYNNPTSDFKGYEGEKGKEEEWTVGKEISVDEEEQGKGKKPKYVFCVIGQTLSRSETSEMLPSQDDHRGGAERESSNLATHNDSSDDTQKSHGDLCLISNRTDDQPVINNQDTKEDNHTPREERPVSGDTAEGNVGYRASSRLQDTELVEGMKSKVKPPYTEFGAIKRDSKTERLLEKWRNQNKELAGKEWDPTSNACSPDKLEPIYPFLDQIDTEAISPEELEAIRLRMSGAWSMSEEPKRHSQAPHLKWAKNVVCEILGHSEEEVVDEPNAEGQENQGITQSESNKKPEDATEGTVDLPVITLRKDEESEPELDDEYQLEEFRDDEDFAGRSWGDAELRNGLSIENRKRNSNFFPDTQLYQQYSEAAQNFEILRQSRSDALSVSEESTHSPAPSPPPARRPLPPLPAVPHPHSLSHTGSITSFSSLQIPEPPKNEGRPSSPRLSISLSQSPSLWRELPAVRNSIELEELGEAKRRLQEVRFEVVTSEASYCRSLDIVVEHFVKSKQLGALLGTQDKNWLFSRLTDVRAISHSFLSKLEERVESDVMHFTVCDIIARHCHRFRTVYVPYLTNQSYQDDTYQRLMNDNPRFKRTVENLEKSPVCQRLPLRSFLVLPFQRITRIKLLVQNIVKRTTPDTPEWKQAIKALKLLENLIQESNDSISQMKSIESLVTLSAKVEFECRTLPLISQFRRLVREGPVTELMEFSQKETERKVYLHLFNDNLLLSLPKEGGRFTVIDHCPVSDLRAENCRVKLLSLQKNLFRLHMSQRLLLLRAETQSDKLRWISALSRPHPKTDFSAAEEFEQMQCIRGFVGQQPDELSLDKADIILVHPDSAKCDDWVEGTKLSDRQRGWVPRPHLEIISNAKVKKHNLSDALKLTTATAAV